MTIIQLSDIYAVITSEELMDVISNDLTKLDTAELVALGEVTGYLDIRYDAKKCLDRTLIVPDTAVPPAHNGYSAIPTVFEKVVDIMLNNLFARVMPHNIPELRQKRYDNAITWLEKVADGFIAPSLPVKTTENTTPLRFGNTSAPQNPYY